MLLFSFPCVWVVNDDNDNDDDDDDEAADMRIIVGLGIGDNDNVSIVGDVTGSNVGEPIKLFDDSADGAKVVGVMVGWEVLKKVLFAQ